MLHWGDALWLILVTPQWYFSSITEPFSAGVLSVIPSLGIVCLPVGIALGVRHRDQRMLLFCAPFVLSVLYVGVAGLLRGALPISWGGFVLYGFLGLQLLLTAWLIYRLWHDLPAATMLGTFSMTYAFFAGFVASMAFTDSRL